MNKVQTCPSCNGTNMAAGSLASTGNIHFRPEGAKFLKLQTANVDVAASLCMDCGHVVLTADTEKVKALQGDK
ncbi:MAG: PF20097 family protein [Sedimentisphaerales bacterium]|jgi:predicted nucleic-acid-binding Zn-ribbon protein